MKRFWTIPLILLAALLPVHAMAQLPPSGGLVVGSNGTQIQNGVSGDCLTVGSTGRLNQAVCTSGSVTTFSAGTTGFTPNSATSGAVTLAGTLIAVNGGTGFASFAVGDLLYADTTTTLAKLADVATTNVLLSGGIGAAPSWGKVANAALATQATNTIVGNATSGTASPTALAIGTCSTAGSALIWTTNTGFGCNTSITAAAVPASGLTGSTLAAAVTASSLTSAGATFVVNGATIGSDALAVNGAVEFFPSGTNPQYSFGTIATALTTGNGVAWRMGQAAATSNATLQMLYTYIPAGSSTFTLQHFGDASGITLVKGGTVLMPLLTNVATTSALCFNTGTGLISYDGTLGTCTVSALRYKDPIANSAITKALPGLALLRTESWRYKQNEETAGQFDKRVHIGLYADDVEKMDKRCVGHRDGHVENYDRDCVLAYVVKALNELGARK